MMNMDLILSDEPVWKISPYLAEALSFRDNEKIWLYAGFFKKRITVRICPNYRVMTLDRKLALEMKINQGKWQIKREPDGIRFGPIIGIVCQDTKNSDSEAHLIQYLSSLKGGLSILLTPESFDEKRRVVYGRTLSDKGKWLEGEFPWPDSVYMRACPVTKTFRKFLIKEFPDNHFNSQTHFNKWRIHQILENYEEIQPYLPETARFTNETEQLNSFLAEYQEVYLKPMDRNHGLGVIMVSKDRDKYIVRYREDEENKVLFLTKTDAIKQLLLPIIGIKPYIIQQGLNLSTDNTRRELRVLVQKRDDGLWKIVAVTGRDGVDNQISFKELLEEFNSFNPGLVDKIYKLSIDIALAIEAHAGNIGEIGLDLGIDNRGKLWIIKTNGFPQISLFQGDPSVEKNIYANPIQYATYLAGFSDVVNPLSPTVFAPTNSRPIKNIKEKNINFYNDLLKRWKQAFNNLLK